MSLMTSFLKVVLVVVLVNTCAITFMPTLLSILVILLTLRLIWTPLVIVLAVLNLRTDLRDSVSQFGFHRHAFDKALSIL